MWKARPRCFGELAERGDLSRAIDETIFRRVGNRQRRRLDLMDVLADAVARGGDGFGQKLGAGTVEQASAWRRR